MAQNQNQNLAKKYFQKKQFSIFFFFFIYICIINIVVHLCGAYMSEYSSI